MSVSIRYNWKLYSLNYVYENVRHMHLSRIIKPDQASESPQHTTLKQNRNRRPNNKNGINLRSNINRMCVLNKQIALKRTFICVLCIHILTSFWNSMHSASFVGFFLLRVHLKQTIFGIFNLPKLVCYGMVWCDSISLPLISQIDFNYNVFLSRSFYFCLFFDQFLHAIVWLRKHTHKPKKKLKKNSWPRCNLIELNTLSSVLVWVFLCWLF